MNSPLSQKSNQNGVIPIGTKMSPMLIVVLLKKRDKTGDVHESGASSTQLERAKHQFLSPFASHSVCCWA